MVAEFKRVQATATALNAQLAAMVGPKGAINPAGWNNATKSVKTYSDTLRAAANSSGMWEVTQMRLSSAADDYTNKLEKQKVTFRDMWKDGGRHMREAYREQLKLRHMFVQEIPGTADAAGKKLYNVGVPSEALKSWDTLSQRVGFFRENLGAASIQLQNWGKNTQWAGRQLMAGFTYPLAAAGAAAGVLAYQVDKEMTRIAKVYDSTLGANASAAAREIEINNLRAESWATVEKATAAYGAAATETLQVQAELAAQGMAGLELQESTANVMRIATLGEFEAAEATKTLTALMATMGYNAEQAGRAFDYMNSVENATSLATQDFARAIPIALGPLKEMGGDVQDLAMLLVAMRERGIEAGEGANAIKSMMQRLYRPSKQIREEWQQLAGIDLVGMVDDAGGNVMKILPQIRDAVANLGKADRVQLLGGLFGTYQVARQNAILKGLENLQNGTGQVTRVLEVNRQGWEKWGETADNELRKIQESASGKFRIALNTIKNQLAEMGEPFLNAATAIMGVVSDIINTFANAPDFVKGFIKWGAIIMAVVGPLTMLVGLGANFIGTLGRMSVAVMGLFTKFGILNKQTAAQKLALSLAERGMLSGSQAASLMAAQMRTLAESTELARQTMVHLAQQAAGMPVGGAAVPAGFTPLIAHGVDNPNAKQRYPKGYRDPATGEAWGGRYMKPEDVARLAKGSEHTTNIANETERSSKAMHGMAISAGVMAASMATMAFSSNETANTLAELALTVAIIGPAISGMAGGLKALAVGGVISRIGELLSTKIVAPMKNAAGSAKLWGSAFRAGPINTSAVAAGKLASGAAAAAASSLGISLAIAAAAYGGYKLYEHLKSARNEAGKLYDDAQGLASIYGYTPVETEVVVGDNGKTEESMIDRVRRFKEEYADVVANIERAKEEQDKLNYAREVGLRVINTGGTKEMAEQAVFDALAAAEGIAEARRITLRFKAELDFGNAENVANMQMQTAMQDVSDAIDRVNEKGALDKALGAVLDFGDGKNIWANWIAGADEFSQGASGEAKEIAENAGMQLSNSFYAGLQNGDKGVQREALVGLQQAMQSFDDKISAAVDAGDNDRVKQLQQLRAEMVKPWVTDMGVEDVDKLLEGLSGSSTVLDLMGDQASEINTQMKIAVLQNTKNRTVEQDRLLSDLLRLQYMKDANNAAEDGEDSVRGIGNEADRAATSAQRLAAALNEIEFSDVMRGVWENVSQEIGDNISDRFTDQMQSSLDNYRNSQQSRLDSLDSQQEAATNAFENRWERRKEAVEKHFDSQINAINRTIEAENRQEENRKRIFDAEMARIERMKEAQNLGVDFNVALDEGNLDEAARIRNEMAAKEEEWTLEDANARAERESKRRVRRLEKEADRLENLKDKRLKAIEEVEEAERRALERSQERRREALENEVNDNIAAQEEIWQNRKEKMDEAIEYFLSFTPRNEKELQAHIARTKEKYGKFNINVEEMFDTTSMRVGSMLAYQTELAANGIVTDINWSRIGNDAARDMLGGALGMSIEQFANWMKTGKWPKNAGKPFVRDMNGPNGIGANNPNRPDIMPGGVQGQNNHGGGWIGEGDSGRKGVARTQKGLGPGERLVRARDKEFMVNETSAQRYGDILEDINRGTFKHQRDDKGRKVMGGAGNQAGFAGIMGSMLRQAMVGTIQRGIIAGHNRQTKEYWDNQKRKWAARKASQYSGAYGQYSLPGVKPWVLEAANYLGGKYGISSILGVGQRSANPTSDHPKGLALDFMTSDVGKGNALAAEAIKRWQDLDATYLIWRAKIHSFDSRGWQPYTHPSGATDPTSLHMDHVHLSFSPTGDVGDLPKPGGVAGAGPMGPGGAHRPINAGVSRGLHDTSTAYPAVDMSTPTGTPVFAVGDGRISSSYDIPGYEPRAEHGGLGYRSYGRVMTLSLDRGGSVLYAHLSKRGFGQGARVKGGTQIGLSGNTGYSTGPHLHFGAANGNPYQYLSLAKGAENIRWDNTIANLHKGEMVLTEDLSNKLKQGIDNLANGAGNQYNVNVNVLEPGASADDIAQTVIRTLRWQENRKPRKRNGLG